MDDQINADNNSNVITIEEIGYMYSLEFSEPGIAVAWVPKAINTVSYLISKQSPGTGYYCNRLILGMSYAVSRDPELDLTDLIEFLPILKNIEHTAKYIGHAHFYSNIRNLILEIENKKPLDDNGDWY